MRGSRIALCCLVALFIITIIPINFEAQGEPKIRAAFFYSPDCPCSNSSIAILNALQANYSNFEVKMHNLYFDDNWTELDDFYEAYNVLQEERYDYPFIYIGDFYFTNRKISYNSLSQVIDSYQGQDVQLWPEWGDVRWTTCVILFHDSTTSEGLVARDTIQSFNESHIRLAVYDTHESAYNATLRSQFLEAYDIPDYSGNAVAFIGDDMLLGNEITESNIEDILLTYSGVNTPCRDVSEQPDYGNICVTVFYSATCGECYAAKIFLTEMDSKYPELNITYYNILDDDNEVLKQSYAEYYGVPVERRGTLMVFIGDRYFTSVDSLKDGFEDEVKRYEDGVSCPVIEPDEDIVIDTFRSFSVLTIMAAGLIDGINPCAFATLIFFISYLRTTKKSERQMLLIGISFVLGIFITYLLLGIGVIRGMGAINEAVNVLGIIYITAGIVAIIFGIVSLLDYLKIRKGKTREMVLKLPKRIKELVHWIIEKQVNVKYFTVFAFFTGVLISLFEFVCTGQVYLPTLIYISQLPDYRNRAIFYLVLYNIMFIVPLVLIFIAAYFGVSDRRLKAVLKKHVGLIKVLTAVMFFALAAIMILQTVDMMG